MGGADGGGVAVDGDFVAGAGDGGVEEFAGVDAGCGGTGDETHLVVFRALGSVDGQGEEALVFGKARGGNQEAIRRVSWREVGEPDLAQPLFPRDDDAGVTVGESPWDGRCG